MTIRELREVAKQLGIKNYSKLKKPELEQAIAATQCPDKLELPAIPDDDVVDLFACLIDVTQPQCRACNDTGRIAISVGGTALPSNLCECVKRDGKRN